MLSLLSARGFAQSRVRPSFRRATTFLSINVTTSNNLLQHLPNTTNRRHRSFFTPRIPICSNQLAMSSKKDGGAYGAASSDTSFRKTWDRAEYAQRAADHDAKIK